MEVKHRNSVDFIVYGDYALFTDPLIRSGGEKFTSQVPSYEAVKGILQSIYWKPTFIWYIDMVRVLKPIRMETKGILLRPYAGDKDLSYYTYLKDVTYQVRAHFEWNPNRLDLMEDRNENKHYQMAKRFIKRGGRRDIFLGTRECQGYVEPCTFNEGSGFYDNSGKIVYGNSYHGITYADEAIRECDKNKMTVRFWNAIMEDGIINYIRPDRCTVTRTIKDMDIKPFDKYLENFSGIEEFNDIPLDEEVE